MLQNPKLDTQKLRFQSISDFRFSDQECSTHSILIVGLRRHLPSQAIKVGLICNEPWGLSCTPGTSGTMDGKGVHPSRFPTPNKDPQSNPEKTLDKPYLGAFYKKHKNDEVMRNKEQRSDSILEGTKKSGILLPVPLPDTPFLSMTSDANMAESEGREGTIGPLGFPVETRPTSHITVNSRGTRDLKGATVSPWASARGLCGFSAGPHIRPRSTECQENLANVTPLK